MSIIVLLPIAIGLSMDAFAVAVSSGITLNCINLKHSFRLSFFFGAFQGIMPLLGWFSGNTFSHLISSFDHWIAFTLLTFVGGKMIYESFFIDEKRDYCATLKEVLILSIATSIDAFAVGVSFSILHVGILKPALIISIITFFMSFGGTLIGNKIGHFFEQKIEILGGIILIGMGIKILLEHLT